MKEVLGSDFSEVRIHIGPEAPAIGALAFTFGAQIFFAPGQFAPSTPHGQRLIAHELTHVVQQRQGRVHNPLAQGVAVVQDPGLEAEAERMSLRVLANPPARETAGTPRDRLRQLLPGTIQRATLSKGGGGLGSGPGGSKYSDKNLYDGQIYAIYQNHDLTFQHDGKHIDGNRQGEIVYVGQTLQGDVGARFVQHVNVDADQPWHRTLWPDQGYDYASNNDANWPYYPRELWAIKQQTQLETSADEQYFYEQHGGLSGDLHNKITPLTKSTFLNYKSSSTFRGTGYPSGWTPKK